MIEVPLGEKGFLFRAFMFLYYFYGQREREREAGRDGGRESERITWRYENSYPVLEAWAKNCP